MPMTSHITFDVMTISNQQQDYIFAQWHSREFSMGGWRGSGFLQFFNNNNALLCIFWPKYKIAILKQ